MTNLINNAWVIGIGGGILSGLIVTLLTRKIFARRDNKEYIQKLSIANNEVLYALRPGVSEGHIPKAQVIDNLISATARKYSVRTEDMYDVNSISEELIKEVMDSSFISASTKSEFCEKLSSIQVPERPQTVESKAIGEYDTMSSYRKQTVLILGMMTGLLTTMMALFTSKVLSDVKFEEKLLVLILPAIVTMVAAIAVRVLKDLKMQKLEIDIMGTKMSFKGKPQETSDKEKKKS